MKPMTDEQMQDANTFFASEFEKGEHPVRSSELVSLRQTLSWINQSLRHPRMDYHQQMMEVCQRISTINTPELRESLAEAIKALKQANQ